ncbi:NUDIX hydrolase [Magnetospirillum molischianum]|uniref:ADP-ribose pyrophosphatase n=1 Tax=Magnetospirillum molischianum DSM 120 TaxID=1150626 RepID=H8FPJ6_MAGML|nr:NUDIX hydrolase [Magnetospirillum molischianum]CCG40284.1 ADP-ribose pyrophosphatase [Magnetospirillum molischianum DSM 120]
MSRSYPDHPLPGVLALLERDGRFLMVLRAHEPDRGKWGFPGGLIELGETVIDAALRELREETGLVATAGPVIDVFDVIDRNEAGRVRYHFVLNVVRCSWQGGEAVAGDDAAAIAWIDRAELKDGDERFSVNVSRLARL